MAIENIITDISRQNSYYLISVTNDLPDYNAQIISSLIIPFCSNLKRLKRQPLILNVKFWMNTGVCLY